LLFDAEGASLYPALLSERILKEMTASLILAWPTIRAFGKEVCKIPDRALESAETRPGKSFLHVDFGMSSRTISPGIFMVSSALRGV
jgi:hypothetical protein